MGVEYCLVNHSRREYLDPERLGRGGKLCEWESIESRFFIGLLYPVDDWQNRAGVLGKWANCALEFVTDWGMEELRGSYVDVTEQAVRELNAFWVSTPVLAYCPPEEERRVTIEPEPDLDSYEGKAAPVFEARERKRKARLLKQQP